MLQGISGETVTTYDADSLTRWTAVCRLNGTIFSVASIWRNMGALFLLIVVLTLSIFRYVSDPHNMQSEALGLVARSISALVGFILGLFLLSSLNRWWETITAITGLFEVIRALVLLASSRHFSDDARRTLARLGCLCTFMLEIELTDPTPASFEERFDDLQRRGKLTKEERLVLSGAPMDQRSYFTWVMIKNFLVPYRGAMDAISYDRLVELIMEGMTRVRVLRTLLHFQFPFIYIHILAFLVHMSNLLAALGSGVTLGILFARSRHSNFLDQNSKLHSMPDPNTVVNEMVYFFVQTFFYQAFLNIGSSLTFPLSSPHTKRAYRLPFEKMVASFEAQVGIMCAICVDVEDLTTRESKQK
jgi:hypothetical protein